VTATAKKIFVTGTHRTAGKTVIVLGLMLALEKRTPRLGFIKPLGKRDMQAQGVGLDEDSLLIERVSRVHCSIQDMSPVTIDREFSEDFFRAGAREPLMARIVAAYERIAREKDLVVIEGTGHACLGSVYGLSNAEVAKTLGAKVLIVSAGGVGQPIDEIALSASFFQKHGVEILGAVVNRARPHEVGPLKSFGKEALDRLGVRLLGVIPHHPIFDSKTVLQVFEGLHAQLLNGESRLGARVSATLVGGMTVHNAIDAFEDDALLIAAGDRTDLLIAATASKLVTKEGRGLAGVVLTSGIRPPEPIVRLLKKTDLPVAVTREKTYETASLVMNLEAKIAPNDRAKHEAARALVEENVDVGALYEAL
jgi:BioD-like phosphotransacetylase family protein